jgi:hypothetical protein
MLGSLYGALPVTGTGQLSLPDQKPVGAGRTGSGVRFGILEAAGEAGRPGCGCVVVAALAGLTGGAVAAQPAAKSAATHPASASHDRFTVPPRRLGDSDRFTL